MNNMELWGKVCRPPETALKQIRGGRLGGMTDIKPQWRYKAMTEIYGPCGIGWYFKTTRKWIEEGSEGQRFAFVDIELYIKDGEGWSNAIEGTGGSMLVVKEKKGLHSSDEAFKMATTDALSTAMKMIGVGADIYMGQFDGTKYIQTSSGEPQKNAGDYTAEVDKLESVEAINAWLKDNWGKVNEDLIKRDVEKLKKYIEQVRDVFDKTRTSS